MKPLKIQNKDMTAVILAGGQAKRFGGADKGLINFKGKPLVQYAIEAVRGEAAKILLSVNRNLRQYQQFNDTTIIADLNEGFQGPLAGILSAMKIATTPYLLVLPCDCPNVQTDLVVDLKHHFQQNKSIIVAKDKVGMQPLFAILKTDLQTDLSEYLSSGERKLQDWYQRHPLCFLDDFKNVNCFENINSQSELDFYSQSR